MTSPRKPAPRSPTPLVDPSGVRVRTQLLQLLSLFIDLLHKGATEIMVITIIKGRMIRTSGMTREVMMVDTSEVLLREAATVTVSRPNGSATMGDLAIAVIRTVLLRNA